MNEPTTAELITILKDWVYGSNELPGDAAFLTAVADRLEALEAELADKFETFGEWKASVIGLKELEDSILLQLAEARLRDVKTVGFNTHKSWNCSKEFDSGWNACRKQVEEALIKDSE